VKPLNFARVIIGIGVLVVCALISNLKFLIENAETKFDFVGKDGITQLQKRIERAKDRLPSSGVIRYASGVSTEGLQDFKLTQYILAPLLVVQEYGPQTAIYVDSQANDTSDPADPSPTINKYEDGTRVFDFHNGIKVVRMAENNRQ